MHCIMISNTASPPPPPPPPNLLPTINYREIFVAAREGFVPQCLSGVHVTYRTPLLSILLMVRATLNTTLITCIFLLYGATILYSIFQADRPRQKEMDNNFVQANCYTPTWCACLALYDVYSELLPIFKSHTMDIVSWTPPHTCTTIARRLPSWGWEQSCPMFPT